MYELMGGSPALRKIRAAIPRLASDTAPIVIIGETGVGKSLVASHIHSRSRFKSSELEIINFSLLSDRDQRIQLFGGGPPELNTTLRSSLENPTTLILKHLDQASLYAIQERLTEFLQTSTVIRPGINEKYSLAARVIFTFQSPIPTFLKNGRLHPALAELLSMYETLRIPPIRSRKTDIPILAERFLHRFYDRLHSIVNGHIEHVQGLTSEGTIEPTFAAFLMDQKWPENVTELKAFLRSLIVPNYTWALQEREKIEVMKMVTMLEDGNEFSLRRSIAVIEDGIIQRALEKFDGHQARAAQFLGLTGRTIRRRNLKREQI